MRINLYSLALASILGAVSIPRASAGALLIDNFNNGPDLVSDPGTTIHDAGGLLGVLDGDRMIQAQRVFGAGTTTVDVDQSGNGIARLLNTADAGGNLTIYYGGVNRNGLNGGAGYDFTPYWSFDFDVLSATDQFTAYLSMDGSGGRSSLGSVVIPGGATGTYSILLGSLIPNLTAPDMHAIIQLQFALHSFTGQSISVDNLRLETAPEPGALALMGGGLTLLALRLRARSRR